MPSGVPPPLKASVNCDMGEDSFSNPHPAQHVEFWLQGDDEALTRHVHLANVACGFHASDFSVMNKTVQLAKNNGISIGAHPSLPDLQGFGRREMAIEPDELKSCFIYQLGPLAVLAFSSRRSRSSAHQTAAEEAGVRFIPEWFADLDYTAEGKLIITQKHDPVPLDVVQERV
ncbi:unnamed protein product [Cyclocybe aegerita]|uniref:Uncharacterized protein n=1 Tax=Cyclocybe aegerita TaxID=1973307 RepID=A0A8S0WBD7_CYCAE|nr:unnamed protein product [Cyclocybe aegerita]